MERSQTADHSEDMLQLVSMAFHSVGIVEGVVLKERFALDFDLTCRSACQQTWTC